MLFYDQSEASRVLMQWLQTDPRFVKMRQGSSVTSVHTIPLRIRFISRDTLKPFRAINSQ